LSLLLKRQELISDACDGELPLSIRRTLAGDFRECQRWSRRSNFADLEVESARAATSLFAGGPFERNFAGTSMYGLVRRVRSKLAKRVRGLLLSDTMSSLGFGWLSGETGWPMDRGADSPVRGHAPITNVAVGGARMDTYSASHRLSSEAQHAH
jgi:hypothetical protein